ncbi:uncharacterized protein LOC112501453 [Cynara cardunculus var. scolymus]|uniref:uncharacterized protein LOC112501453 n=1 Tax=Cynara cardunculus var. scolymus TaxID=59895 RepID=UPI000D62D7BE|nr:uncharacterized protein LOC112501453 [Cynara cardunculus var. scolymus]XP_024960858.1 uncharacterized protein LOC112501453 [Cynara cardunculus var. scolymus]
MECNKDEAIRAKEIAESKMMNNDFEGARKIALKARRLFPELENISQLLTVCDVHCSAQKKMYDAEMDLYGILQVESLADEVTIRKQYRKLALVLHPDKNKFPGAEAAFKLVGQANMVLSDKGKRYLHDVKCRQPAIPSISKQQTYQNSHIGAQRKYHNVSSSQFAGVNHHQQSHSDSNGRPSFCTYCSSCKNKYEYYRDMVNKRLRCPQCSKLFTAYDMSAHWSATKPGSGNAGTQNVNPDGRPASFQQENPKFDAQKPGQTFSNFAYQPCSSTGVQFTRSTTTKDAKNDSGLRTKMEGNDNINTESVANAKKKPREARISKDTNRNKNGSDVENASKGTGGNPSAVPDSNGRRSRKRVQVSDSEKAGDDFSPRKRSRLRKLSSDVEDKQKEQVPKDINVPKPSADAEGSMPKDKTEDVMPNGDSKSNLDSEGISEPIVIHCRDLEFGNFDKDKESFAVDQIWACYDSVDGMPRFYAQIRKVYSAGGFRLRITWLEADPENHLEVIWANEGLPVACGKFVRGDTEETRDHLMFSHQIAYEKGDGRYTYVIYPKKGEVWALFRDWDINWSSDPKKHMKYQFEIVEVLSEFDNDNGVLVAYMVKVEGFVSLFQKTSRARLAEHRIPSSELFRFSHCIPSVKLTGTEREDVPVGSCELDTASLPDDLDNYYISNKTKVNSETKASCPQSPEAKVKPTSAGTPKKSVNPRECSELDREMLNPRRSPRGVKGGDKNHDQVIIHERNVDQSNKIPIPQLSSDSLGKEPKLVIHDFNVEKQDWKFQEGQIWALCRSNDRHPGRYAQIKKIESSPLRLHVDLLESCTQFNANGPDACGLFKASIGRREVFSQDAFLYLVKAELNGKNRFNIYPKEKEIWVLYDKPDFKCTSDFDAGECNIVEVVENNGHIIKVLPLSRVPGYKSVFRGLEMQNSKATVLEIQQDEFSRFSSRVPAFLLTEEQDGRLKGSWELDLAQVPGLFPS